MTPQRKAQFIKDNINKVNPTFEVCMGQFENQVIVHQFSNRDNKPLPIYNSLDVSVSLNNQNQSMSMKPKRTSNSSMRKPKYLPKIEWTDR